MIRTVEQYLDSLKDGRLIYAMGEKVKDVTTHPILQVVIQQCAMDYYLCNDPKYRSLFVGKNDEGEDVNFMFLPLKNPETVLKKREVYIEACRICKGTGSLMHAMGVDALAATALASQRMDKQIGTKYSERVEAYRKYIQKGDVAITGAITDVKGDRSLRPSKQKQHKDYYVRVVDRQKDGIIVRGAKVHISATPAANEALVLPCRAHAEEDKDYAVVFSTPLNAKGITLIYTDPWTREIGDEAEWDLPVTSNTPATECLIVFDDVFVPWERVFMCGEWQFSRGVTWAFATFHRLYSSAHMVTQAEMLAGTASLLAEYNGLEKYEHIKNKLAWLAWYAEAIAIINEAACTHPEKEPDIDLWSPNGMYINVAKFLFAELYHEATKVAQDIGGGILTTGPNYRDWANPEIRKHLEKFLSAKDGIPTEHRLKALRSLKDQTFAHAAAYIHAEGSLAAQRIAMNADADWERYRASALRLANIPGWEKHPLYGKYPDYPSCIKAKMPPIDKSYKL